MTARIRITRRLSGERAWDVIGPGGDAYVIFRDYDPKGWEVGMQPFDFGESFPGTVDDTGAILRKAIALVAPDAQPDEIDTAIREAVTAALGETPAPGESELARSSDTAWDAVGPFYSAGDVQTMLGGTVPAGLLALTSGDGTVVYPAWQFANGVQIKGVADVMAILPEGLVSPWRVAAWLSTPEPEYFMDRPIDWLDSEQADQIVAEAHDWARALAQ